MVFFLERVDRIILVKEINNISREIATVVMQINSIIFLKVQKKFMIIFEKKNILILYVQIKKFLRLNVPTYCLNLPKKLFNVI